MRIHTIRRRILIPIVLLGLASEVASAAGTYYVDRSNPACSNSGAGTVAQPYCTISAAAAARGGPGVTILVAPGVYPEQVTIPASGAPEASFELRAQGGVVLDGADDFSDPARWVQHAGDVWLAAGVNWVPKQVFADGARLTASQAAPASLPPRTFRWVAGAGLYVNAGGGNPGTLEARIGRRSHGFLATGRRWVALEGFTVTRAEDRGIYLTGACENLTISRNTVTFSARPGIQVVGGFGMSIESNVVTDNLDHGIALTGGASACVLEDNESARNAHPAQVSANGIHLYGSPGNILRRNRLHHNQDTGLHIQSGSNNCSSYLNRSWSNGDHGYDHQSATGTLHVCDVAHGNLRDGFSIKGGSTGTRLHNSIATDNGIATNQFDLSLDATSNSGFTSSHNVFWNSTGQPPVKFAGTPYPTVASYSAVSGQDPNTLQADPRFVDPAAGDFHLRAGSPAIDNGHSGVPQWPALDAEGQARRDDPTTPNAGAGGVTYADRGALEYVPVDQPPILTAPATVSSQEASPLTFTVTAVDPDGQPIGSLTADLSGLPPGATFTVGPGNATGTVSWVPGYFHAGTYNVSFFASAGELAATASTAITITNSDRAPEVVAPATASVAETGALSVTVHAGDVDGEPISSLTADLSGLPAGHDAVFTPDPGDSTGTLTWTPTYADSGTYSVTFTAANALSGSGTTAIHVSNLDRAPAVAAPPATVAEASPLSLTVSAADVDGDVIGSLTANLSGLPAGHNAVFTPGPGNATGTLTWTPTYDDAGSWSVSFTAANAMSGSATATLTVTNIDRAPVVSVPALVQAAEVGPLTLTVNAADPDGQPLSALTANLAGLPAGSNAVFTPGTGNTSGTLTWTPTYADSGSYSVIFTSANALAGSATAVIHVANTDRAPAVTAPAAATVQEAKPLTVTVQASDVDGDAITSLTANLAGLPAGHNAVFTTNPARTTGTLTWTPTHNDAGSRTVTFTAANAMNASATTTITITNVDRPPVVTVPLTVSSPEATPLVVTVLAVDPDGQPITSLVADLSGLPAGATFTPAPGNATGTLTWSPGYFQSGSYTARFFAGAGGLSATGTSAITITNLDRAPVVVAPATTSVAENGALTVTVNASDADGEPIASLAANVSGLPAGHDAQFVAGPGNTSGTLTWTPAFADSGTHSVSFTAANGASGSATTAIHVSNVDRAPIIAAPAGAAGAEASPLAITVHAADLDDDAISLSAGLAGLPAGHNAVFTPDPGDTTGTLTWTPTHDDAGSWSVSFTAANGLSATTATSITVANTDRAPVVSVPALVQAAEVGPLTLTVNAADPDGQPLSSITANLAGLPAGHNAVFTRGPGDSTGTLTWTPTYADSGSYSVTFTSANALSGSATAVIHVANTDRAPAVTAPAAATVAETGTVSVTVNASDIDGDAIASLSANLASLPAGHNAVFTTNPAKTSGTLTWTPTYDDAGTHTVAFTAGNALTGSASTAITVTNVDRAPTLAAPPTFSSAEASPFVLTVQVTDPDGQPITSLLADLSGMPAGATFTVGPGNTTGTVNWSPGYFSAGSYSARFFTAAGGVPITATTAITITNLDRAPAVVAPAAASVAEAGTVSVTVHAADVDLEPISSLTVNLSGKPLGHNATFVVGPGDTTGTLTWTPTYEDSGSHTVTFTAANAMSGSATTVIHVSNVDRAPILAAPAAASVAEAGPLTLTVHAADLDQDAISLTADLSGLPAGATFTRGPGDTTGAVAWTPSYSDSGRYTVTFTAANALSATTTTAITVVNTDRGPVLAAPAAVSVAETGPITIAVHAADPDGDAISMLTADLSTLPAGSDAVFTAGPGDTTGTLTWTPTYADSGHYTVTFTALNVYAGTTTTSIAVANVDRAPIVAAPGAVSVAEATPVTFTVHAMDPDGDAVDLTADLLGLPAGATFTPGPADTTGTFAWTPTYSDSGRYTVAFTAANALSGAAGTSLTVTNVDRAPVLTVPATASAPEATPLGVAVAVADPDGDAIASLTADLTGLPAGATFTAHAGNTTGTLSWTPGYADSGHYTVSFTAANALSATGSTAITVPNVDRAPVLAAPAAATVAEAGPLTVVVHAADLDADAIGSLTANLSGLPAGHNAVFTRGPGDSTGTLTWTPSYDHAGVYTVTFTAANALSATAGTVITVSNVDRSPVVTAPAMVTVAEAVTLSFTVHAADPDGDPFSLFANLGALPEGSEFNLNPGDTTGTLTWTPTYADSGTYTVSFAAVNTFSATASTVIRVTNVDREPLIAAPGSVSGFEAGALSIVVHAADPDGDAITSLSANLSTLPAGATFTRGPEDSTGTLAWTPAYADSGHYTVTFTAANAMSATAITAIAIHNVDRAPLVSAPTAASVAETGALSVTVHALDPDGDAVTLSADLAALPAGHDAVFARGPGDTTGTLTWTPTHSDSGRYTVTFTAANAMSGSAGTSITVTNTDRAPTITVQPAASVSEASPLTIAVQAADPDGDAITGLDANLAGLPAGSNAVFTPDPGNTTGTLTWTPEYTHAGSYTVTFTATNAMAASRSTAITVLDVDRAPAVTAPAAATTPEAGLLAVTVSAADSDGDAITSLDANLAGLPAGSNAVFTPGPGNTSGTLTWTPTHTHAGSYTVSFTAANALSGSAGTTITVTNVDRAPVVAAQDTASAPEAGTIAITVHAADTDGEAISALTADLSGLPAGSGATFTADPGDTTGTFTWTPGYAHAGSYTVTFTAANELSGAATTLLTVSNVDRAPAITAPVAASVTEEYPLTIAVEASDVDGEAIASLTADFSGLPPGAGAVFTPEPGNATGTLSWTPARDHAGTYVVTFTAANAMSVTAGTTITVIDGDAPPEIVAPAAVSVAETGALTLTVQVADPNGEPISSLTADLSGLPAGNDAVFTPGPGDTTGTLTWTPTYAHAGSYTVTFTASNARSDTAHTVITVTNTDRAPVVTAPATASVLEASRLTITVQASDVDAEAIAALTADVSGLPAGNDAVFTPGPGNTSGTLTWTPSYADSGSYTVTFTAANALTGSATTAIAVANVNHPYTAGTFYVDISSPSCSNLGAGTPVQPYCSISAAIAAHSGPGTLIVVRPGVYREQITVPASGTSENPLVIQATGPGVVVDGADDLTDPSRWTQYAGNVWVAASVGWSPLQVFADGARMTASTGNPANLAPGIFRWRSGEGLYVNVGGGNPASHQLRVGRRDHAFVINGKSWVTIDGFTVTRTEDRSILATGAFQDLTVVRNNVTFSNRYGIQAQDGTAIRIASNTVSDNNDHGISITNGVTNSVIEDNESFRNARPVTRAANGIYVHGSSGNVLRRNRVHDNQDTGMHFQNGANNNIAYLNRSWNNGDHGYDHLGAAGTIHMHDVAYGNYLDGFSVEGNSPNTRIYNSIATDNGLGTGGFDLWVDNNSSVGFVSDYNLFWNSTGEAPVKYISTIYSSVAAYSAASGRDANSLQTDPMFVAPADGDFHLHTGSPAIDNADSGLPGWPATDAEGRERADDPTRPNAGAGPVLYADRGALEYRPAVLTIAPAAGVAPLTVTASAAGSVGPDGSAVSFRFDFGDGTVVGPQPEPTATHTYGAGSWNATVTVFDKSGGASPASAAVAVNARPNAALAAAPTAGKAPLTVTLNASASGDPDGSIVSYRFDFGDGVVGPPQSAPTTTHAYGTGSWTPTVTITDDLGATATAAAPAAVVVGPPNVPPVSKLNVTPASGQAPLGVTADASQSSDADGSIVSYRFDFGDGTIVGPQASASAAHEYPTGSWTLTVTVTDDNGGTSTATTTVLALAEDHAPMVTAPPGVAAAEADTLTLVVRAADPDGQPLTSLVADLSGLPSGNDAVFTVVPGDTMGTLRWVPTYADSGTHTVTFTAANGLTGSASTIIAVGNTDRAPAVAAPAAANIAPAHELTVPVTVADPDGDAVASLVADLSGLPPGHNATFVVAPGNASGTLAWTPAPADTGSYAVTFTAANALSDTATTVITVNGEDNAPVVTAPAAVTVAESGSLSVPVEAGDDDGDGILSLTADLSALPAGHNAVFTTGPGKTSGTLTWTPTYADAGSYTVQFTAANALQGVASTVITVSNVDRAPAVTAPAFAGGAAGQAITVPVTAADADGNPIASLTADLSSLPPGHDAVFTAGAGNTSGTLVWTPAAGVAGTFGVTFTAANALSGSATTSIAVGGSNQLPVVVLTATPSTGNDPLTVTANASGSSDPDGTIVSYRFAFGDGTVVGPQAEPVATHVYGAGAWTLTVVVTDDAGGVSTASRPITVAAVGAGPNLVANPSFETNTSGWGSYAGSTIQRVAEGFDGGWSLRVTGPDSVATFGVNDSPNWVATTPAAGTRYRFTAWVRSASSGGQARIRVREYLNGVRIGATGYFSSTVSLSPTWEPLYLDYIAQVTGTSLDVQVEDVPLTAGEVFQVDNLSIRVVSTPPNSAAGLAREAEAGATAAEEPLFGAAGPMRPLVIPNPARGRATIDFATSRPGPMRAELFDASGRRIRRLANGPSFAAGRHSLAVDGRDDTGAALPAGVYFYRIESVDGIATGRFVLMK